MKESESTKLKAIIHLHAMSYVEVVLQHVSDCFC